MADVLRAFIWQRKSRWWADVVYTFFLVDIQSSFVDIKSSFADIKSSFVDIEGSFVNIDGLLLDFLWTYIWQGKSKWLVDGCLQGSFDDLYGSFADM